MKWKYFALLLVVVAITRTIVNCDVNPTPDANTELPPGWELLSEDTKEMAILGILSHKEVSYAAIAQDGTSLSLAVIVVNETSQLQARELGSEFVRLVQFLISGVYPEGKIGQGHYDYIVSIYYPDGTQVALGIKLSLGTIITW